MGIKPITSSIPLHQPIDPTHLFKVILKIELHTTPHMYYKKGGKKRPKKSQTTDSALEFDNVNQTRIEQQKKLPYPSYLYYILSNNI